MAAYADKDDIAAEFKGLSASGGFTASTNPTSTQVNDWCTRASALIDSKIAGKYETPVDESASPNAFLVLMEICIWLVRARVSTVLNLQTGDSKTSSGPKGAEDWNKKAKDALEEIQSGKMKLTDATLAVSGDGVDSFTNNESATLQPPTFTREDDNW